MIKFSVFIFFFIQPAHLWAQNPASCEGLCFVSHLKACHNVQSALTSEEIRQLKKSGHFPLAGYTLDRFIKNVQDEKTSPKSLAQECTRFDRELPAGLSQRSEKILKRLVASTYKRVQSDQKTQELKIQETIICLSDPHSKRAQSSSCEQKLKNTKAELNDRLKIMRLFLARSQGPLTSKRALLHDSELSLTLSSLFFSDDSPRMIPSLTDQEIKEGRTGEFPLPQTQEQIKKNQAPQFVTIDQMPPEVAALYYRQILSASPVLMHFSDRVTDDGLLKAALQIQKRMKQDQKETSSEISQKMMLLSPHVAGAMDEIPADEKAEACTLLNEVHRNIWISEKIMPERMGVVLQYFSAMALGPILSLPAIAGNAVRTVAVTSGMSALQTVDSHYAEAKGVAKYLEGVSSCSRRFYDEDAFPDTLGECDFSQNKKTFQSTKENIKSNLQDTLFMAAGGAGLAWASPKIIGIFMK